MKPIIPYLIALLLCFAPQLRANPAKDISRAALADLQWRSDHPLRNVSYLVTEKSDKKTLVFRVLQLDNMDTRHTLLSINGKPASEKEAASFAKKRNKYSETTEEHNQAADERSTKEDSGKDGGKGGSVDMNSLLSLIEPDSLILEKSDEDRAVFSFICMMDMGGKDKVKMNGSLSYDRKRSFVDSFGIKNAAPFKPDFKVKLDKFEMNFEFARNEELDQIVPSRLHSHIKGNAFLLMSFDEEASAVFNDFRKES